MAIWTCSCPTNAARTICSFAARAADGSRASRPVPWSRTRYAATPPPGETVTNDGHIDLYVGADGGDANRLYVNDGRGGFEHGPPGPHVLDGGTTNAVGWADLDHDGDIDLVVHAWGAASAVYENLGGCSFRRITAGDLDAYLGNWSNWEGGPVRARAPARAPSGARTHPFRTSGWDTLQRSTASWYAGRPAPSKG